MKKKIFTIVAAVLCLCALCAVAVSAENAPETDIVAHNLSLNDSVNIVYYADFQNVPENAEKGILIWTSAQDEYIYGSENAKLTTIREISAGYTTYAFTGVSAKMMSQDIYAKSYIKVGDEITYGPLNKYSVLQYAYNKKGSTTMVKGGTIQLGELLVDLLNYGASSQKYFGYNLDRLANATYYKIDVVNGTLPDGMTSGLYPAGTELTITAEVHDGENFDCWQNSNGDSVGSDETLTITVTSDETYTAVYVEEPVLKPSEGLEFTSNGDGTCCVSDPGDCKDVDIVIPSTSPEGDTVTSIGNSAFKNNTSIKSITIPSSVISIEANAFRGCSALEEIIFIGNEAEWNAISKGNNWDNGTGDYTLTFTQQTEEHTFGDWNEEVPATCANDGVKGHYVCSTCGKYFDADQNEIVDLTIAATADHTYGEWIAEFSATCTNDGVKGHYTCSTCQKHFDAEYNEISDIVIPAGHKEVVDPAVAPTCEGTGLTEGKHCSVCQTVLVAQTVVDALGHNWDDGVVTKTPTDTEPGVITYTCSRCKTTKTEDIPIKIASEGLAFTSNGDGTCYVSGKGTCTDLDIVIPTKSPAGDTVTAIGANAFSGCSTLTSIEIPNSVTSIGSGAFKGCSSLESMIIPFVGNRAGVTASDTYQYPFGYIFGTTSYTGGTATTQKYYGLLLNSTSNTTYYIPSSLKSITVTGGYIPYGAFYNCSGLTSITIGNGVTSIGEGAFNACSNLESITIPFVGNRAGVTASDTYQYPFGYIFGTEYYTGGMAKTQYYYGSSTTFTTNSKYYIPISLKSVTVTGGYIPYGAFLNCSKVLYNITIGNGVTGIGSQAFFNCDTLDSVNITDLTKWCEISFGDSVANPLSCGAHKLYLNGELVTELVIPEGVTSIGAWAFYGCTSLTSVNIPASVTSIGWEAFRDCSKLESITFAENSQLTSIANGAFSGCDDLVSISIPNSVTSIGNEAFKECRALTTIDLPSSVTSIGEGAFRSCSALTSIKIPENITSIGNSTFIYCTELTSVDIPVSVTSIGDTVFYNCGHLTSINYNGTKAQWNEISKGSNWNSGTGDYTIYCTDENISK